MKVVILAGGLGSRISEETNLHPKPMIRIGSMPILWHIMKIYSAHGFNEFVICCGYKGYIIKEFFANYLLHTSDVTIDMANNHINLHNKNGEEWMVSLVDTGEESMTGGRLKRISEYVKDDKSFFLTYGDGVSDIDISASLAFHEQHGKLATITAVQPPGRFGALSLHEQQVMAFVEKPAGNKGFINGGFFVLSPKCLDFIDNDAIIWEHEPLVRLAEMGQLMAYEHKGFWQPMDTLRDKNVLENLWSTGDAPWKKW
jgi:glucose-1-phosphate cytidylyltransferase